MIKNYNQNIESLCKMWDDVKIVQGKPSCSVSDGLIERTKHDIERMLETLIKI